MTYEHRSNTKESVGMNKSLIHEITASQLRSDIPNFRSGDTVNVLVRIKEGTKERIQAFQGIVVNRRGGGISETFTVRKLSNQVGVERTFPLHSPIISQIEVVKYGKVRRNKLTYLRTAQGKAARIKEDTKANRK